MNRIDLNNEIILCRPAVKKAKVIVSRKIIKKIKILSSCKNEAVKEKKLEKAKRLYERISLIKKLKVDAITKFALINENYEVFLKKHTKEAALASLAKYTAVAEKVENIRNKFSDWKTELPLLLDSFKKKKKNKLKNIANKKKNKKLKQNGNLDPEININLDLNATALEVEDSNKKNAIKQNLKNKVISNQKSKHKEVNLSKSKYTKVAETFQNSLEKKNKNITNCTDISPSNCESNKKVNDPFFVEKKIVLPKLNIINNKPIKKQKNLKESSFHNLKDEINHKRKVSTIKANDNEKLHPSWAAKKVQLIRPFEGKKIKFSDD